MVKANMKREVWLNISSILVQASKAMPSSRQFTVGFGGHGFGMQVDEAMKEARS